MGYAEVDDRASTGEHREYRTTTCKHCNSVIVYQSKPIGGFLRSVRTSYNKITGRRKEEIGSGFWCHKCGGDICAYCGEKATKTIDHVTMEKIADVTGNAISKGINVWTPQGQVYVETKVKERLF